MLLKEFGFKFRDQDLAAPASLVHAKQIGIELKDGGVRTGLTEPKLVQNKMEPDSAPNAQTSQRVVTTREDLERGQISEEWCHSPNILNQTQKLLQSQLQSLSLEEGTRKGVEKVNVETS